MSVLATEEVTQGVSATTAAASPAAGMRVTLVDSDEAMTACVEALAAAQTVALDCEGVDLGRLGSVTLVQLATETHCFVLDIMSQRCDVEFLRRLLEDPSVLKIVHDPACDADALLHHLRIRV
jgi:ribonuclease D